MTDSSSGNPKQPEREKTTTMTTTTATASVSTSATAKSSKRKFSGPSPNTGHEIVSVTVRNHVPSWTYFRLELISDPPPPQSQPQPLDPLTASTHLRAALSRFLGVTGTAIPIDILKCGGELDSVASAPTSASPSTPKPASTSPNEVWIRVPSDDGDAVAAALSSPWIGVETQGGGRGTETRSVREVGWQVLGRGQWLAGLVGKGRKRLVVN